MCNIMLLEIMLRPIITTSNSDDDDSVDDVYMVNSFVFADFRVSCVVIFLERNTKP